MQNLYPKITTTISSIAIALTLSIPILAAPERVAAQTLPNYSVPTYTCVQNFYLSPTGSDSNTGASASSPWLTLQKADANVKAGDCVNLASGIYNQTTTVNLRHGGNANTPTGYVTYRSTTPQGAHILMATQQPVSQNLIDIASANYLFFDGIEFDGNNGYAPGNCIGVYPAGVHHIIVENSLVHSCATSGIGLGYGEYYWIVNNTVYDNCNGNEGSAIDVFQPDLATVYDPSFVPNANDQALYYHIVVANNVSHDNIVLANDGSADHTDGNGILFDDFNHHEAVDPLSNTPYTQPTLIVENKVYNNGAGGITVYESQNITIANNSAYNDYIDQLNSQMYLRGEIICGLCNNSTFINNAAYSVVGSGYTAYNNGYSNLPDTTRGPVNVAWTSDIGYPGNAGQITGPGDLFYTNPLFNNPAAGDFSLQAGSPAIGSAIPEPWLTSGTPNIGASQSIPGSGSGQPSPVTINLAGPSSSFSGSAGGSFTYTANFSGGPTAAPYEIFVNFFSGPYNCFTDSHFPTLATTQWTGGSYSDGSRTVSIPTWASGITFTIVAGLMNPNNYTPIPLVAGYGVTAGGNIPNEYIIGTLTVQ